MIFLQLFVTFFIIGLFTFGGGTAMLSLIQMEVVHKHAWIGETQFTDIVAISQCTPGPVGINCATYVGYEVGSSAGLGVLGSACATFALVLPTFLLFFGIVTLYNKYRHTPLFGNVMGGLRPAVAGFIAAAAIILTFHIDMEGLVPRVEVVRESFSHWSSWVLLAGSFAASMFAKINPILLILAGGIIGLIIY